MCFINIDWSNRLERFVISGSLSNINYQRFIILGYHVQSFVIRGSSLDFHHHRFIIICWWGEAEYNIKILLRYVTMRLLMILWRVLSEIKTTHVTFVTNELNKVTDYISQNGFSFTWKNGIWFVISGCGALMVIIPLITANQTRFSVGQIWKVKPTNIATVKYNDPLKRAERNENYTCHFCNKGIE